MAQIHSAMVSDTDHEMIACEIGRIEESASEKSQKNQSPFCFARRRLKNSLSNSCVDRCRLHLFCLLFNPQPWASSSRYRSCDDDDAGDPTTSFLPQIRFGPHTPLFRRLSFRCPRPSLRPLRCNLYITPRATAAAAAAAGVYVRPCAPGLAGPVSQKSRSRAGQVRWAASRPRQSAHHRGRERAPGAAGGAAASQPGRGAPAQP